MLFKNKILNDFYVELFSTDFRDYSSKIQNMKTDILPRLRNSPEMFGEWLTELIHEYCKEYNLSSVKVTSLVFRNNEFYEMIKDEFESLTTDFEI